MVQAAIDSTDEWTMGLTVASKDEFELLMPGVTEDMFEEYCFVFDMIGINGHTIFAGKPKAGQEDAVDAGIESALGDLKEKVSFYPAGQEAVENSVSGETNDGYFYFVIHHQGETVANAMTSVG